MSLDNRNEVTIKVKKSQAAPGVTVIESEITLKSDNKISDLIHKAKELEKSFK